MVKGHAEIRIKRVYDPSDEADGTRVLVDRLWPRGLRKENVVLTLWLEPLIMAIHRDEARWCCVLTRAVHQLEGAPSLKTGAFYEKAMAIPNLPERLAFLNRGQGGLVRKLKALLPTIRDETIHADLIAMLASHERNIGLVAADLPTPDRIGAAS